MPVFTAPGYTRTKAVTKPKLGPLLAVIDGILEADKTSPVKQRHTAKRVFERLRDEHGFGGGYMVVKDYVRMARARVGISEQQIAFILKQVDDGASIEDVCRKAGVPCKL